MFAPTQAEHYSFIVILCLCITYKAELRPVTAILCMPNQAQLDAIHPILFISDFCVGDRQGLKLLPYLPLLHTPLAANLGKVYHV
jgi:hypothetical protein